MSDFGHQYARGPGFCMDGWGTGPFQIGRWYFLDSDRFGPEFVRKDGEPRKTTPKENDPFWDAYKKWRDEGRPTRHVDQQDWTMLRRDFDAILAVATRMERLEKVAGIVRDSLPLGSPQRDALNTALKEVRMDLSKPALCVYCGTDLADLASLADLKAAEAERDRLRTAMQKFERAIREDYINPGGEIMLTARIRQKSFSDFIAALSLAGGERRQCGREVSSGDGSRRRPHEDPL